MFKEKYIKYKTKYIALKIQLGGEKKEKKEKKKKKKKKKKEKEKEKKIRKFKNAELKVILDRFNANAILNSRMPNYIAPSFLYSLPYSNILDGGKLSIEYEPTFNSINLQYNSNTLKYDVKNYHLKISLNNIISLFIYFNKSYLSFIEVSIGENNKSFPVFIINDQLNIIAINQQIKDIDIQNKQNIKFLIFQGLMKVQSLLLEVDEDHEISYDKLEYLKEKLELCNLINF